MNGLGESGVKTVAVVGTGTIGRSWISLFLANGLSVNAFDKSPEAEKLVRESVEKTLPDLREMGFSGQGKLHFTRDLKEAVATADFIQESATEDEKLKIELFREMDQLSKQNTVIATSSSQFQRSTVSKQCQHRERILVAHPFNPPHLIPLIEIVGETPSSRFVKDAVSFFKAIGSEPVVLKKEILGHLGNRLQAGLFREAVSLLQEGVASVEDIEKTMKYGLGLRWAIMGPFLIFHLNGGKGGIQEFLQKFGKGIEKSWENLGAPHLTEALVQEIVAGVNDVVGQLQSKEIENHRDDSLKKLLNLHRSKRTLY